MSNTANTSMLKRLEFSTEGTFAEQTDTKDTPLTVKDFDFSGLEDNRIERTAAVQRLNDSPGLSLLGTKGGTFTVEMELYGHGTAPTGALTATNQYNWLSYLLGGSDATADGGTVSSASNAYTITSTGFTAAAGNLIRVGAQDEGPAGQGAIVQSYSGNALVLRNGLPATPSNGQVIYPMLQLYPELNSSIDTSLRHWLGTANEQYWVRGCALQSLGLSGLNPGEVPTISATIACADWEPANETFPSTLLTNDYPPIVCNHGSMHVAASGTQTRAADIPRNFQVEINYNLIPLMGPSASSSSEPRQAIQGWRRGPCEVYVSYQIEAEAAGTHTDYDIWQTAAASLTSRLLVYTAASVPGASLVLAFPNLCPVGNAPKQADLDGLNYTTRRWRAYNDNTGSTDLARSHIKIGLG